VPRLTWKIPIRIVTAKTTWALCVTNALGTLAHKPSGRLQSRQTCKYDWGAYVFYDNPMDMWRSISNILLTRAWNSPPNIQLQLGASKSSSSLARPNPVHIRRGAASANLNSPRRGSSEILRGHGEATDPTQLCSTSSAAAHFSSLCVRFVAYVNPDETARRSDTGPNPADHAMRTPIGAPLNVISIVHRLTHSGRPLEHALFKTSLHLEASHK
jgi:hypothetical protein